MRVLIAEGDATISALLARALRAEGDSSVVERDGITALKAVQTEPFDAIVLDVTLPNLDGFSIAQQLRRRRCETPILMLTARKDDRDVVHGLNVGADDCLTKPFSLDVFFARLRAISRRGNLPLTLDLAIEDLHLFTATRDARRGERKLPLSRAEYILLELLMKNTGRVVLREQIIDAVWGHGADIESNTLDALMHTLRSKVEQKGTPKLIHTIRGTGYCVRGAGAE